MPRVEPNLDSMAQEVQKLFMFKNFFDQMDLNVNQRLPTKKKIIDLSDFKGGSDLVKKLTHERTSSNLMPGLL